MKIAYVSVVLLLLVALPNISSGFHLERLSKKNNLQISYHTYSTGRRIDVFTQRGGKGQGLPSDPFCPHEEVLLYANVTYNDSPIGYKYVGFGVKGPDGTTFAEFASRTNDSGIANNRFRLPYPPDNPEEFFGTWKIIATVDIADVVVNDTMYFEYGYLPLIVVPDNYSTIQEAINHANQGGTILVRNGIYYEHIVVNKTVSLIGESNELTIIDGNNIGSVVAIRANNITMSGFTVQNSGTWADSCIGLDNVNYGIEIYTGSMNSFYHNSFINNNLQVHLYQLSSNSWDDGYPSGGNYWSDYNGIDLYHGPYQNETGSDGIGDTPYLIDAKNTDCYPLMKPCGGIHDIGIAKMTKLKTVICQGYSMKDALRVINYGLQSEAFNVTVKIKSTTLNSRMTTLASRNSIAITINTTFDGFMLAKGNHTINTFATPVPNETSTSDNNYSFWIIVSMVGDICSEKTGPYNGWPDGRVDMSDIYEVYRRFGKFYPNPEYVPNYDIDNDGRIDMSDIYIACKQFGKIDQ